MNKAYLYLLFISVMGLATSCSGTDDISFPEDPSPDIVDGTVTQMMKHTEGKGVDIVIMADGYSQQEINDGKYRQATQKAIDALFAYEPMASLKQFFDIYEIVAISKHSGIDGTKQETAFSTYIPNKNATDVYGDSLKIQEYMAKVFGRTSEKLSHSLAIVLLNCDTYAGMTLIGLDQTVTDSIPSGISISYIPAYSVVNKRNIFPQLIQHEAVGHGLGKLGDEYFYDTEAKKGVGEETMKNQKLGAFMNIHYDAWTTGTKYAELKKKESGEVLYELYKHPIEQSSFFYPLTIDPLYSSEALQWYEGGFEYPKTFYRPTLQSMMNETIEEGNDWFNAPSRLMIYKRIMREANGTEWKCDITNKEDYDAFVKFDERARSKYVISNGAKGIYKPAATTSIYTGSTLPPLASPKIIKQ